MENRPLGPRAASPHEYAMLAGHAGWQPAIPVEEYLLFRGGGAWRKIDTMLREISIRDYKLIRDMRLEFGDGFNVLTGETGAGKSQLLDAVTFGLGARASGDEVSKGAEESAVEVALDLADARARKLLLGKGLLDDEETEIILRRVQSKSGRASAWLNGRRVPVGVLKEVADELIEMLGQFERSRLLKADALDIIDEMGDEKHVALMNEVASSYRALKDSRDELARRKADIDRLGERRELMQYQYDELNRAELEPGEESKLEDEHKILSAAASLIESARLLSGILYEADEGEAAAYDVASKAESILREMAKSDASLIEDADSLSGAAETLAEVGRRMSAYADKVQVDESRLAEVDSRLGLIHELKRKYSTKHEGLIGKRDELAESLRTLNDAGADLSDLEKQIASGEAELVKLAAKLTSSREKISKLMEKDVRKHLKDLELTNAKFAVELLRRDGDGASAIGERGADRAQLLLATNPVEDLKPLRRIASGGELSRILLALKAHLAHRDRAPILVFDEADVGIGGENAYKVGRKLKELARDHQLILISHLPQVAGMARHHFKVEKITGAKGAVEDVGIECLKKKERILELSRMLGESADEKASRKLAEGMLDPD